MRKQLQRNRKRLNNTDIFAKIHVTHISWLAQCQPVSLTDPQELPTWQLRSEIQLSVEAWRQRHNWKSSHLLRGLFNLASSRVVWCESAPDREKCRDLRAARRGVTAVRWALRWCSSWRWHVAPWIVENVPKSLPDKIMSSLEIDRPTI